MTLSDPPVPQRKKPRGSPSTDLILSTVQGTSADLFPQILRLHVPKGATIADTTYGQGVFWRKVPPEDYQLLRSDLHNGVDARSLPYQDQTLDAVVFDPPWMPTSSGETYTTSAESSAFERYYRNNQRKASSRSYMEAILGLYYDAAAEALRVLKQGGIYIVKCQDQIHANRQWFVHVDLMVGLRSMGFTQEDLFILMRHNRPGVSRILRQAHARKNSSFFLVFRKHTPRVRARSHATP